MERHLLIELEHSHILNIFHANIFMVNFGHRISRRVLQPVDLGSGTTTPNDIFELEGWFRSLWNWNQGIIAAIRCLLCCLFWDLWLCYCCWVNYYWRWINGCFNDYFMYWRNWINLVNWTHCCYDYVAMTRSIG